MKKIAADRNYELVKEAFELDRGRCTFVTFEMARDLKAAAERLKKFNILTLDAIGTWDILEKEIIPAVISASNQLNNRSNHNFCSIDRRYR